MRNPLPHTVGMHSVCENTNAAFYAAVLSSVNGEIFLLPVRVHHVENAHTWLPTLSYVPLQRITFNAFTFVIVTCVFKNKSLSSGEICFPTFKKLQFLDP